jgi:hypothetical protein
MAVTVAIDRERAMTAARRGIAGVLGTSVSVVAIPGSEFAEARDARSDHAGIAGTFGAFAALDALLEGKLFGFAARATTGDAGRKQRSSAKSETRRQLHTP